MTTQTELITYRREKARETLQAARILLEADSLFSTVNRTYYALFNEHFIKPGIVRGLRPLSGQTWRSDDSHRYEERVGAVSRAGGTGRCGYPV